MKIIFNLILAGFLFLVPAVSSAETAEIKVGVFTTDPERLVIEGKVLDYLSGKTGVKFSAVPLISYEKAVNYLAEGRIDAGIFGSAPAYLSIHRGVAEPIARPEAKRSSVYYGYWLTLKDSGLSTVDDFKGKRFAYVDPYTSAGYLFARAEIKSKGYDPEKFFGTVKFSKTHEAAIQMVLNGMVDGCAAKDSAYKKFIDTNIDLKDRLRIIKVDGPFPERTLTVSLKIDEKVRKRIRDVLLEMDKDPDGKKVLAETGRDRYVAPKKDDFSAIDRILTILGGDSWK